MPEVNEPVATALVSTEDPKPGKLKVKVVGKCDGAAIKGAEVVVVIEGAKTKKTTDDSGIADFGNVSAHEYVIKAKKHYTDSDYFVILVHYPRITWKKKAIVEALSRAAVPEGGEVEARVELKTYRVVTPIVFKRKQIAPFTKDEEGDKDPYGHWWTELGGGESYGWWPSRGVGPIDTVLGIPGALNGVPNFPDGTPTSDPHDGDPADQQFSPVIDDCRSDDDLKNAVRAVARGYSGNWSWFFEFGNHCHTFQKRTIESIKARGFKDL